MFFFLGKICSDIKFYSLYVVSVFYVIDFDGEGGYELFIVYCDMIDRNEVGVMVVSYDSEFRMLVDGYDKKGFYECYVYYIDFGLISVV